MEKQVFSASPVEALVARVLDQQSTLSEKHEAFEGLVHLFQNMAFACAYSVVQDFHLAEDAAQSAFITVWQKLDQLREPAAFPGWFRQVVHTECSRIRRRQRSTGEAVEIFNHIATAK